MTLCYKNRVERLYKEFGRRLRDLRKAAGLSQLALAERVGLSRTSITNIELGRQHIPLHVLYPLASALGAPPAQLLPDKDFSIPEKTGVVVDLLSIRQELEKHGLGDEDKKWIERVVLKSANKRQGASHESTRAGVKGADAAEDKKHSRPG
jgi:transcriptional regulator with XRE-family HTH domain